MKIKKYIAVILSGGVGNRLDKQIPKQFIKVNDYELLFYSLNTFVNHPLIDEIYLVYNESYLSDE